MVLATRKFLMLSSLNLYKFSNWIWTPKGKMITLEIWSWSRTVYTSWNFSTRWNRPSCVKEGSVIMLNSCSGFINMLIRRNQTYRVNTVVLIDDWRSISGSIESQRTNPTSRLISYHISYQIVQWTWKSSILRTTSTDSVWPSFVIL